MLKILMVTERYVPIWGGAENQLRQLIPHLLQNKLTVGVVTRRWHAHWKRQEVVDGVPVVRLGISGSSMLATVIFTVHLIVYLIWKGRDYDIFHSHGAVKMGCLCRLCGWIAGSANLAKIATAGKIPGAGCCRKDLMGALQLKVFRRSDGIVAISREIKNELRQAGVGEDRIITLPNGVDIKRFHPVDKRRKVELRESYGIDANKRVVVFSGRLVPRKGADLLLEAWSRIEKDFPDWILVLVGSGKDQKDSIEDDINKRLTSSGTDQVVMHGETDRPEDLMALADVLVFPSRIEGFPNVLLEGMAAALPVLSSHIGGVEDVVIDGRNGLLFTKDDVDDFSAKIRSLLFNISQLREIGHEARKTVEEKYSFEIIAENYVQVYSELHCNGREKVGSRA